MEKLNKVARYGVDGYGRQDIYRDDEGGEFVYHDDFKAMQQRAEAAEAKAERNLMGAHAWEKHARRATAERDVLQAKLADLDRQEPYGWLIGLPGLYPAFTLDYRNVEQAIAARGYEITPIYTRPAPAINLAELAEVIRRVIDTGALTKPEHESDEAALCAIVRNIEEAK